MLRDTRYAIRLMLRRPVFAVSAILTLAFCIGANTAIYTVVDLLLRPLPYPEPDRLVEVVTQFWRGDIGFGQTVPGRCCATASPRSIWRRRAEDSDRPE